MKKTWEVNLHLDSDEQCYSSCVGIDIASLKKSEYSVVFNSWIARMRKSEL